jgi:hypothetical protein
MESLLNDVREVKTPTIPVDDEQYEPTAEDLAWLRSCDWAAGVDSRLPFADWIGAVATSIGHLTDERYTWLAIKVDELGQQALFMGAQDPATFNDRVDAVDREMMSRHYWRGYSDGKLAV